jgi:prepilin-type N-terminal cleavage/methylation domain-containing protein
MKDKIQNKQILENRKSEKGFTLMEMVIVLAIISIISTFAIISLTAQKVYEAETQTLLIIDILQEARQRALSQRTTMRVEINATLNMVRLIDERTARTGTNTANDDVVIKTSRFMGNGVYIGSKPANVTNQPTELSPVPVTAFATSNHPLSNGNSVMVLRFKSNGTVENAGSNNIGTGATPTGSTIYVWSKFAKDNSPTPTKAQVMRGITVLASSGSSRMWKCFVVNEACSTWTK